MDDAGSIPARGSKGTYTPYMAAYLKRRYRERRARAIALLGGRCVHCGATDSLELDHINPDEKQFEFGDIWSCSFEVFDAELKKAQLLCRRCHIIKTAAARTVGHGGGVTGVRNCRCELCAPLKRKYAREHAHKWRRRKNKAPAQGRGSCDPMAQ